MERIESLVIINQRQWGIIAPQRDADEVDKLATCRLTTCFGFSLHDPNTQVGVLAHLDSADQVVETVNQAAHFFRSLGAEELVVRTVNLRALLLSPVLRNHTIELREIRVVEAMGYLRGKGFRVNPEWTDMGEYENVILDARCGLRTVEFAELGISPEQDRDIILYYAHLLHYFNINTGQLDNKPMSCKYIPQLI